MKAGEGKKKGRKIGRLGQPVLSLVPLRPNLLPIRSRRKGLARDKKQGRGEPWLGMNSHRVFALFFSGCERTPHMECPSRGTTEIQRPCSAAAILTTKTSRLLPSRFSADAYQGLSNTYKSNFRAQRQRKKIRERSHRSKLTLFLIVPVLTPRYTRVLLDLEEASASGLGPMASGSEDNEVGMSKGSKPRATSLSRVATPHGEISRRQ
ncbi:hypothetical protein DFP72DRAFT_88044 [Ephemerocybe angulata]|uniref:Uncharacterized protein n=1 Tax=Ephemerocybe angulata TaxID=980116 RepID=A0A8H6LUC3_9AGAR|nr:hypothetical protein DFP72DRAFT_88044 [Tulosesus angulatus]